MRARRQVDISSGVWYNRENTVGGPPHEAENYQIRQEGAAGGAGVCGIGILFSILIVLGMDIYRKHTYTSVILPDAYRITDMKATAHTSYSVNGSNTDYVYIITVKYEIDGTSYTDTLQILQGTHFATELHARYLADNAPEEVLGNLYYSEKDPSHIGRYGDDSLFVE